MATKRKSKSVRKAKSTPPARVLDSMNQVWLAGLGAMSKARQGAPLMLQELITEGTRIQTQARGSAEKMLGGLVGEMKSTLNSSVKQVRSQTADALDNLEEMFQTRVHRALTQLGVPSAEDVQKLSQRVELLNASVNKLANGRKAAVRARPRTVTPKSISSAHAAAH